MNLTLKKATGSLLILFIIASLTLPLRAQAQGFNLGSGLMGCDLDGIGGIGGALSSLGESVSGAAKSAVSGVTDAFGFGGSGSDTSFNSVDGGLDALSIDGGDTSFNSVDGGMDALSTGDGLPDAGMDFGGLSDGSIPTGDLELAAIDGFNIGSVAGGLGGGKVPTTDSGVTSNTAAIKKNTGTIVKKETCLDHIAVAMSKIVIRNMTESIVTWINTGFNGEPLFLSNPERYFGDIALREYDQVVRDVQNSSSIFARDTAVAIAKPKKEGYDLSTVVAQNCVAQEEAQKKLAFNSSYTSGDYSTRLARAEKSKKSAPQGFLAKISFFSKKALAAASFGLLAQDGPDSPGGVQAGEATGEVSDDDILQGDDLESYDRENLFGLESGDFQNNFDQTGDCPTTKEEADARTKRFLNGEFSAGGLNSLYALSQNPENNPYGAFLNAKTKIAARQETAKDQAKTEIIAGRGFLSQKECIPGTERYDANDNYEGCEERVVTTGSAVANAADQITASSFRQAELNRELGQSFDQIIDAMINQIINQGFSTLSRDGTFLGRTAADAGLAAASEFRTQSQINRSFERQLGEALDVSKQYITVKKASIAVTNELVEDLGKVDAQGAYVCSATHNLASGEIGKAPLYSAAASAAQAEINTIAKQILAIEKVMSDSQAKSVAGATDVSTLYSDLARELPTSNNVRTAQTELQAVKGRAAQAEGWVAACDEEAERTNQTTQPQ